MGELHWDRTPVSRSEYEKVKYKRDIYEIKQERIANGLLVTFNKKSRVYFEKNKHFQIFLKYWVEDDSLSIKECLRLMKEEIPEEITLTRALVYLEEKHETFTWINIYFDETHVGRISPEDKGFRVYVHYKKIYFERTYLTLERAKYEAERLLKPDSVKYVSENVEFPDVIMNDE